MKDKTILIIGGTGFIGLHLTKRLVSEGYQVTVLAIDQHLGLSDLDFIKKVKVITGDITNLKDIMECVRNKDVIINLAAIISKDGNIKDPYLDLEVNCKGQLNILEACREINHSAKIIFFGSRSQFGKVSTKEEIKEDHTQKPMNLYGIHKQTAENYCNFYANTFGLKTIVVRPSSVYGPAILGEEDKSIINKFIKKALENEALKIINKGKDCKDFIYIDDLTDALTEIIKSNINHETFNIASPKCHSFIDICEMIIKQCKGGHAEYVALEDNKIIFDSINTCMSTAHIQKIIGWKPKVSMEEGIRKTVDHYKKFKDWRNKK